MFDSAAQPKTSLCRFHLSSTLIKPNSTIIPARAHFVTPVWMSSGPSMPHPNANIYPHREVFIPTQLPPLYWSDWFTFTMEFILKINIALRCMFSFNLCDIHHDSTLCRQLAKYLYLFFHQISCCTIYQYSPYLFLSPITFSKNLSGH